MDWKVINIAIPEGLHNDLKIMATQHRLTLKALIIKILTDYMMNFASDVLSRVEKE